MNLSNREAERIDDVVRCIVPKLGEADGLVVGLAAERIMAWKQPTLDDRLALGKLLGCWCEVMESLDLVDIHAERAYRKLLGQDRATGARAPFPPLPK